MAEDLQGWRRWIFGQAPDAVRPPLNVLLVCFSLMHSSDKAFKQLHLDQYLKNDSNSGDRNG